MKLKFTYLIILFFSIGSMNAQVFWTEDFDGTACAAGSGCDPSIVSWTIVSQGGEGANANQWYVSDTESGVAPPGCGVGGTGDQTLHISNVSTSTTAVVLCPTGDCGANYDDATAAEITNTRIESPTINCTGESGIAVDFNYIENGDGANDDCSFWYYDGATWANIDAMAKTPTGTCDPQGQWTAIASINLPASADNNPNVKIGFLWVNNGDLTATDPAIAINDISLSSTVGIDQVEKDNLVTVFPNPTSGIFTIVNEKSFDKVQLVDISGKVVFENNIKTTKKTTINISEVSNGIYFLKVFGKDGVSIQKLTKE